MPEENAQPVQSTPAATAPTPVTPGARLRRLREERGISVETLRRRTKIPAKTIAALENDDSAYYAADPYSRSFLEQYCDYVGVEPEEFRAAFEKSAETVRRAEARPRTILASSSPMEEESYISASHAYFLKTAAASAVLLALLTLWLWKNADYFGWPPETDTAPSASLYEATFISRLEGTVSARAWLRITADGKTVFEGYAPAGVKLGWKAAREFLVETDSPQSLQLSLDNRKMEPFTKIHTAIPVVFSGVELK